MRSVRSTSKDVAGALDDRLAAWVCGLRYEDLPDEVVRKAKLHVLFLIGSACVGGQTVLGARGIDIARRLGGGRDGVSTIIGESAPAAPVDAAFANAALITSGGGDD